MELVWKFAILCLILLGFKIVARVFKRIGSADNIDAGINKAKNGINNVAKGLADKWKNRNKEERPKVTIH